jgi:hypothetical protein
MVLTVAAALLAGCSDSSTEGYYDVAPQTALARLRQADIIGFRDARQCGMLISFRQLEDASGIISWDVSSGDIPVAGFSLKVTPSGQGSIVAIGVLTGPNGAEVYDGQQHYSHPALMQPLRPSLRELVDAAIEKRPFDWHRLPQPLNTDELCGSERQNLEAGGAVYAIDDPEGMTHADAEVARSLGQTLSVERDQIPRSITSWGK